MLGQYIRSTVRQVISEEGAFVWLLEILQQKMKVRC